MPEHTEHHPHDTRFKQLLEADLPNFISLFFPELAARIDWSDINLLNKEMFTDIPYGARRESDLIAKLHTGDKEVVFLLMVEIEDRQGRTRKGITLPERVFLYYSILWARHRLPMYPIVLYLFEAEQGMGWHIHRHTIFETPVMELRFPTVGLPALEAKAYLAQGTAMAGALSALMDSGEWSQAEHKVRCLDVIGASEATDAVKFLAINTVETYLELSEGQREVYEGLLEKEEHMQAQHIEKTWAERLREEGREKGREEGREEGRQEGREEGREEGRQEGQEQGKLTGRQEVLQKQLTLKFGPLSSDTLSRLRALDSTQAQDHLAEGILTATSLEELGLG